MRRVAALLCALALLGEPAPPKRSAGGQRKKRGAGRPGPAEADAFGRPPPQPGAAKRRPNPGKRKKPPPVLAPSAELLAIEEMYNLSHASAGRAAIDEAVKFVADEGASHVGARASAVLAKLLEGHAVAPGASEVDALAARRRADLPTCNVTKAAIAEEGVFLYRGDDAAAPYGYDCWILRARYHVAPACEKRPPIWRWHWTLLSEAAGRCAMPDVGDPAAVAAAYARRVERRRPRGDPVTVVFLGLSFMGQPFIAVGCAAESKLTGGAVRTRLEDPGEEPDWRPIADVRRPDASGRPGHCTGFARDDVPAWYPKALHGGARPPFQRPATCTADGGFYEFAGPDATLRLCYKYHFGAVRDRAVDAPCGIPLDEVDVLLSYARRDEVVSRVPRLDPHHDDYLGAAVESVDGIYQSALVPQLRRAFARRGMPEPPQSYPRATPQACARVDVHFAHPGVPDFAARAWLAMIATGL